MRAKEDTGGRCLNLGPQGTGDRRHGLPLGKSQRDGGSAVNSRCIHAHRRVAFTARNGVLVQWAPSVARILAPAQAGRQQDLSAPVVLRPDLAHPVKGEEKVAAGYPWVTHLRPSSRERLRR